MSLQRFSSNHTSFRPTGSCLTGLLAILCILMYGFVGVAQAAGSAYFTVTPSGGSYKTGSTFVVTVYETS